MRVEMIEIERLIPYARNARTHSDDQVAQIAASIREFGFTNPLLIRDDMTVIAGHGRLQAARKISLAEVPCIRLSHLTPAQARAYVIADNRLAEQAGWDTAMLAAEIEDLRLDGFDIDLTGFDAGALDAMFEGEGGGAQGLTDPDDAPEPQAEAVTKEGDVWLLGRHRIVCGDSTDALVVDQALNGARAAVCLTDPPYGLGDTSSDKNDYDTFDDTAENLERLIAGFFPLAQKASDVVVLTPGNSNQRKYPHPSWVMAWFTPAGVGSGPWGFCCWQPILCFGKDPKLSKGKGRHPDAIVHTEASEDFGHPCSKPIKFWRWLMERTSEHGAIVYEPFSGSGTTIIAAEMTGRACHAIELSPQYVDVAVRRWQAFTGKTATLESTGEPFPG